MDIELELKEKEIFREIINGGDFEEIAIWRDGEWSVIDSIYYEHRSKEEQPIHVIQPTNSSNHDSFEESIDLLITEIETILNG